MVLPLRGNAPLDLTLSEGWTLSLSVLVPGSSATCIADSSSKSLLCADGEALLLAWHAGLAAWKLPVLDWVPSSVLKELHSPLTCLRLTCH